MSDNIRPKIIVSGPLPPPLGGMETYCEEYLQTDIANDFDITFCKCSLIKPLKGFPDLFNIFLRSVNRLLTMFIWMCRLLVIRPVIAHVHTNSGSGFFARGWMTLIAEKFGTRSILHMHGAAFKEFYAGLNASRKNTALKLLQANTFLMVLSNAWCEFFVSIGVPRGKIVVMENCVVVPEMVKFLGEKEKLTALYLSRIEKRKGVFTLIKMIDENRDILEKYHFVILGPKSHDYREVEKRIGQLDLADSIEMTGPVIDEDKADAYRNAEIYLLQSFAEGMPIGLLEAMSYGLACISSPVGGIPEVIQHEKNGLLIPAGDSQALYNALINLSGDSVAREAFSHAARETIAQTYSWKKRVGELKNLYLEIINT